MNEIIFEQIHARLERIENKLDSLADTRANQAGQLKILIIFISAVVSVAVHFLGSIFK